MLTKEYRRVRRLNWVSLPLLLLAAVAVYGAIQFGPVLLLRWRAQEVVSDAVYQFHGFHTRRDAVRAREERELRDRVLARLRSLGVLDPNATVRFEQSSDEVRVTAEFAVEVAHPYTVRTTRVVLRLTAATSLGS